MAIWQILLAAAVLYGAIWSYFEASRQRDQFHIGAGPGGLAPQAWAALICLAAPIAFPLFLNSRDRASLQEPRAGAPPIFTLRGFSPWGILGIVLGLAGGGALAYFGMLKLAPLGLLVAALAIFGARRSVMTDEMVTSSLPVSFEQVGFRPLRQEEEHEEEDAGFVLNLDRAVPPSALAARAPAPSPAPASAPFPLPVATKPPMSAAPPQVAPAPVAPLRPQSSSVSVQIAPGSSILWAAADEGDLEPEDPRATIAAANPEVFRQLGGIFAPPPAAAAQVPAAYPEPAPAAFTGPMANAPAPLPPPLQPPMQVPATYPGPVPAAVAPRQAAGTYRTATPGGFVAGKPVPDGSRWIVIAAVIALAGVGAAAWWRFGHPVEAPPEEPAFVESGAGSGAVDAGEAAAAATQAPAAEAGVGEPVVTDGALPMADWLDLYLEYFGPIGLLFEKIDYEGFNPPSVCDDLQLAISAAREGLPTAPDEQLEYEVRVCFDPLQQTAEACQERDTQRWSAALLGAKACTHRAQARMVDDHDFAGLLELELESAQGIDRSTQSMSGRFLKAGGVVPSLD